MNADIDAQFLPRVLMITARADVGGGPEHVYQLVRGLADRCAIFIACPEEAPYWQRYVELLGTARMLPIAKRRIRCNDLRSLRQFVKHHGIDIVHSHGHGAGIYARLWRIPDVAFVHTHHGLHFIERSSLKARCLIWLQRLLERRTALTIFVSQGELQLARSVGLGKQAVVIQNGVPCSAVQLPITAPSTEPLRIATVTRYNPQKNPAALIEIVKALRLRTQRGTTAVAMPEFHVFGDGSGRTDFAAQLHTLGLYSHVRIHGNVNDLRDRLHQFDIFLSCSRWEGLPLAALEAMSCKVPVVLSRVAGHQEILKHESAALGFDVEDTEGAVACLLRLGDPALRYAMGKSAQNVSNEYFNIDAMLQKTVESYRDLARSVTRRVARGTNNRPSSIPAA